MTFPSSTSNSDPGKSSFQTPGYDLQPGQVVLNTWEVREPLGRGGMGAVYRVYHRYLQKEMAMKTLRRDQVTENTWRRFQTEAKAIAKLEHPNIVRIFDMGIGEEGQPFYTMELLKGQGLDEWTRRNPITITQTLFVFRQVASGLAFAHERGIIHRDIKPANIVLTFAEANQPPVVKVVDFGIAKLAADDQGLTKEGEVFGSPLYMSPEQASGLKVDQRSDIYSLGCALYETLTGFPPFKGKSAVETMIMHVDKSAVPIERARPEVNYPPGLSAVVRKCMAKEPDFRYSDASQLARDLLKIEQGKGEEVVARLDSAQFPDVASLGRANKETGAVLSQKAGGFKKSFNSDEYESENADEDEDDVNEQDVESSEDSAEEARPKMGRKPFLLAGLVGIAAVIICGSFFFSKHTLEERHEENERARAQAEETRFSRKEKEEREQRDKFRCEFSQFRLSQDQYLKLGLQAPYDPQFVYYLFPDDGARSIGEVGNVSGLPEGEKVRYVPASGLVVLSNTQKAINLGIKLSVAVADSAEVLGKFRKDEVAYVAFPEAGIRKRDCVMDWSPQSKAPFQKSQKLIEALLKYFPKLYHLHTGYAPLDSVCLTKIGEMENLRKLELADCTLDDAASLAHLNFRILEFLSLPALKDATDVLTKLTTAPHLKELMLTYFFGSPEELKQLDKLKNLEGLGCHQSVITQEILAQIQAMPKLTTLDLAGSTLRGKSMPYLLALSRRLNKLVLDGQYREDMAYEQLSQTYGNRLYFTGKSKVRDESKLEEGLSGLHLEKP